MRSLLAVAFALLLCLFARTANAEEHPVVDLYTIGPSTELVSRFGHSLLCTRSSTDDRPEAGRCFDYGVADRDDMTHMVWTSLRGTPSFIPVVVSELRMIEFFKGQGREIERQRLPLSTSEATAMLAAMDEEVNTKRAFAYHPYRANCSTKIRDHIDLATNGRLHKGPSQVPPGGFRDYMEQGHSGRLGILLVMALYLGETNDRHPSPWEAMLLPAILRDGVHERFSVAPEKVAEAVANSVPSSPAVGRIVLFALALTVFFAVRFFARKNEVRRGLYVAGFVLGTLALSLDLAAALVTWPEVTHNWSLLLLLPTDLALPYLGRRLALYLKVRISMAAVFAVLEVASVIHQPMLPIVLLVLLPMAGILSALRAREDAPLPAVARTSS